MTRASPAAPYYHPFIECPAKFLDGPVYTAFGQLFELLSSVIGTTIIQEYCKLSMVRSAQIRPLVVSTPDTYMQCNFLEVHLHVGLELCPSLESFSVWVFL